MIPLAWVKFVPVSGAARTWYERIGARVSGVRLVRERPEVEIAESEGIRIVRPPPGAAGEEDRRVVKAVGLVFR